MSAIPELPRRKKPDDHAENITAAQLLEYGTQASQSFVAGLLRWADVLDNDPEVAAITADDLADSWSKDVFNAIVSIRQRSKASVIDIGAVRMWLVQDGVTFRGGSSRENLSLITAALAELLEKDPTGAYTGYYARLVRKSSLLRRIVIAGAELQRMALAPFETNDPSPDHVVSEISRIADSLTLDPTASDPATISDAIASGIAELRERCNRANRGGILNTGLVAVDQIVPSLDPGQLIVIGARPSVGKTAMGVGIAVHASHLLSVPTYFVSLEMGRSQIGERVAYLITGMPGHLFRSGRASQQELDDLESGVELTRGNPLFVDDTPGLRVPQISAAAHRIKRRHGLGLVIVDYLQLVTPNDRRSDRREAVEQISRDLKRIARELDVPVIALAQLNREVESRGDGKPKLSDLREAGGIEADADVVMLLYRHAGQDDHTIEQRVGVVVAKQRNGPTGEITLNYIRPCMRFESSPTL